MDKLKYTIIKTKKQYNRYCNILEELVVENKVKDEIDLLGLLIEEYNSRVMENYISEIDPVELLSDIISEHKFTQAELARKVDVSPQLITDILKYRREITKKLAYKLGDLFKLNYSVFLKPYRLKKAS